MSSAQDSASAQLARQVSAKYQISTAAPQIARSFAPGGEAGPASPDMTLAHPPHSQQPKDPVSQMEVKPPSDSTGSPSAPADARAISDQVYEIMKRELLSSRGRS